MKIIRHVLKWCVIFGFIQNIAGGVSADMITDEAQVMFKQYKKCVYQIQLINLATGKKASIGSGFLFTSEGHIATNYHVIAQAINYPERYRVEYISHDGIQGELVLLNVDTIHDLAITRMSEAPAYHFILGESNLEQGAKIFSFGNPHDLGMSIVEGIYNGIMQKALYRKILFSGSLNPGMSGGPSLDHKGNVIGMNVSTAGNQISFLVPVEFLKNLFEEVRGNASLPVNDWSSHIEQQLLENQNQFIEEILSSAWNVLEIGEITVPGEISEKFKCWGESKDNDKNWYKYAYSSCSSDDAIFLSPTLSTGKIVYKYSWIESRRYNPFRFYNHYQDNFVQPHVYDNAQEEDITNFNCSADFVEINSRDFKTSLCSRNYKKYPFLYDINLSLASIDRGDRGLLVEVIALGISQPQSVSFIKKFMEHIKWIK